MLLQQCRVHRNSGVAIQSGAEVYAVEFQAGGRSYLCPLCRFQPRTQTLASAHEKDRKHSEVGVLVSASR